MSQHSSMRDDQVDARLIISPRVFMIASLSVVALLVAAHLVFSMNALFWGYDFFGSTLLWVLFDLKEEVTIPTWYSASLMVICSIIIFGIASLKYRARARYWPHWFGLAAVMLLLSVDEAADMHGAVSHKLSNMFEVGGIARYPWVIPGAILALIVGFLFLRFVLHFPPRFRRQIILAGGLFLGGALGMEVLEAAYESSRGTSDTVTYLVMVGIEEALEMAGIIVMIGAMMSYVGEVYGRLIIGVESAAAPSSVSARTLAPLDRSVSTSGSERSSGATRS